MIKILVIGNSFSGKTSIVNRFVQNKFDSNYKATVACDFSMKILKIEDTEIRLQLWDLVGQDSRIGGINKLFCRGASGALVVADITSRESLESTISWKEQVDSHVALKNGEPIPMMLVVNKYDIIQEQEDSGREVEDYMTQEFLENFASDHGFIGVLRTSAKTGHNINNAFSQLVRQIFVMEFSSTYQEDEQAQIYGNGGNLRGDGKSAVKQSFQLQNNQGNGKKDKKKKGCC
ncbi:ras-related protein rab-32 [Stylonychia lemnae]|uniref:Ras-related protein rab-32 n=1 Tax=Stylonychia lemnae TaxID=5949 RepID=A0A078AX15_STYLE|nr:ras-related protein rab-32 [Stylonychia lemnae]|eukprot:CDW86709.1 ras-related protein rab-32 [Stylonychia lemnae]